ncbi:A/G-specific adenine glycosylase [Rhodohalobacter sp. SW132]|nr:A/G-specific adenine glycosylase [Rhodohalobacter sp. SW132]REL33231.1 A/G-specific adenine glycosylase [Rhodohalobacter sp. SW132]
MLDWYSLAKREMPWRNTSDPYRIWISEIMLQQTRVDTVIPYYRRFTDAFPTVYELASADQQTVLKLWEGLGYYSRARNMHHAAKDVVNRLDGNFPDNYNDLLKLKGIGPYTAAAISSIAFNEQQAVVDGNVIRVMSRYFGIRDDVRRSAVKKEIQELADQIIPKNQPGDFNQAVMELGATVCTPKNPACDACPLSTGCVAYNSAQTESIPYKSPAKKVPHHQIGVGIITDSNQNLLIALRPDDAMLGGLWEFPGGKQKNGESIEKTVQRELKEELGVEVRVNRKLMKLKHAYSHFKITLHAYWCTIEDGDPAPNSSTELKWVSPDEISKYPFPKANTVLIEKLQSDEEGIPEGNPRG